jgi:hypothetical protein
MSITINNKIVAYDNISAGNPRGQELGELAPLANLENISAGNPTPVNLERTLTGIAASSSGTEIP